MEDASLFPIALLIDELKHDQIELRLNAIRRIGTIALALGHRRTRDELIPFILDCIDDEDEVLVAIADELGSFVDYVGGPSFAHLILSPLETLAAVEETTVRDHAVASLNLIVVHLDLNQLDSYYIPMLKRLASGDWFTSRASACHLFDVLYPLIEAEQSNLVTLFTSLVNDDTPMVRRASAASLTVLFINLETRFKTPETSHHRLYTPLV